MKELPFWKAKNLQSFMPRVISLFILVLLTTFVLAQVQAQSAPVDQALIQKFARAATDEVRASLLEQHPVLLDPAHRSALTEFASAMLQRRELPAAEAAYRTMLWLAETTKNDRARVTALGGLGSVIGQRGNLSQSFALLEQALALARPIGDPLLLQPVYSTLGVVQRRLGDYESATESFDRSLAFAKELKRDDMAGRVYNNIGTMHLSQGRLGLALEYFLRSLEKKLDDGARGTVDMANTLNNIGAVYEELGDAAQALPYFTRSKDLMERIGARGGALTALSNIGHARAELGQDAAARQAYQQALKLAEETGDGNAMATVLHNLGNLDRDAGDLKSAEAFHRRSLAMREAGGDVAAVAESLSEVARLAFMQGHMAEAESEGTRAVSVASSAGQLGQLARAQLYLGQVYEAQGRLDEALATFEAGVATAETLRESITPGERARQLFLGQRLGPYYSVAGIHAKAGRTRQALLAVERARARTLLDILAAGRPSKRALTDAERTREQAIDAAALSASVQLAEARKAARPDQSAISALQEALRVAREEKESFTAALYASRPDLRILRGDASLVTNEQLAQVLPAGTAAVEFVVEPTRAWAYLAMNGPSGVEVTIKPIGMDARALEKLSAEFARQVAQRDLSFAATSTQLYDALIGAFDRQLGHVRHLFIIPDGALWQVPFQALQSPRGRFLIEERSVSYAPSLSALAALHDRQRRRATHDPFMLAIGDPVLQSTGRLPEAAREVQSLGKLYGADATETAFRSKVGNASVVHVATHGVLDDNNPMYSHLKLASGNAAGSAGDGRLEAWELLDLDMTADVAVLSACQTGSGALGRGEGVVGLSWALFAAGASTAVVSQWEVDSASTTSLMVDFHQRLLNRKSGGTASEALREAAITLQKDPKFRHPFYWAGFIVIGVK
jgi:CHAT domain-containing protein/Tfp pilus assembly protein PilF